MVSFGEYRERFERGISNGLDDICDSIVGAAKNIIREESFDEGTLHRSDKVRKPDNRSRVVAFTAEHAIYAHEGTVAHWSPLAPIKAWVRRNLARFETTQGETVDVIRPGGRLAERSRRSPDAAIEQVARAIQAKIAREGTPGSFFLARAGEEVLPKARDMLMESIEAEVARGG